WKIHFLHILGSCYSGNKKEALARLKVGVNLFEIKGLSLYFLLPIPKWFFMRIKELKDERVRQRSRIG
ncbi:MAG: hypothetical protein KAT04_03400, partial [Methylococcales bacterium]|nr:hypothetical protein [Methylococcales bacterium]